MSAPTHTATDAPTRFAEVRSGLDALIPQKKLTVDLMAEGSLKSGMQVRLEAKAKLTPNIGLVGFVESNFSDIRVGTGIRATF